MVGRDWKLAQPWSGIAGREFSSVNRPAAFVLKGVRVKVLRVILVAIFVVLCGSVLKGATVYVDAAGPNEPGTGTAGDPFRRI